MDMTSKGINIKMKINGGYFEDSSATLWFAYYLKKKKRV